MVVGDLVDEGYYGEDIVVDGIVVVEGEEGYGYEEG